MPPQVWAAILKVVTHINFKIMSVVLIIALIWVSAFSWLKLHDAKVTAKAMTQCPPQIKAEPGSKINIDQRVSKMWCFPIPAIARMGIGFCHE